MHYGEAEGGWYDRRELLSRQAVQDQILRRTAVVLPSEKAIISVSYNTSDYGAEPQRPKSCDSEPAGCPYDSLNLALASGAPAIGSDPLLPMEEVYVNSKWSEMYCAGVTQARSSCPERVPARGRAGKNTSR